MIAPPNPFTDLFNPLNPLQPQKEDDPYFAALGRFIVSYATAEHQIHGLARRLIRIADEKGRIVFSGMRLGDLAERVRGLLKVTKASEKLFKDVDSCVTQLDVISTQRNKLVHRFVFYMSGKGIFVTNFPVAKSTAAAEHETFTLTDLQNMTMDCSCVTFRLMHVRAPKPKTAQDRATLRWSRRPWRYKPPQPVQKPKQRPSALQSPKRQPPASGE